MLDKSIRCNNIDKMTARLTPCSSNLMYGFKRIIYFLDPKLGFVRPNIQTS